jgi:hypothetical protein
MVAGGCVAFIVGVQAYYLTAPSSPITAATFGSMSVTDAHVSVRSNVFVDAAATLQLGQPMPYFFVTGANVMGGSVAVQWGSNVFSLSNTALNMSQFSSAQTSFHISGNTFLRSSVSLTSSSSSSNFWEASLFGGSVSVFIGSIVVLKCQVAACAVGSFPFLSHQNVSALLFSFQNNIVERSAVAAVMLGQSFYATSAVGGSLSLQIGHISAASLDSTTALVAPQSNVMPLTVRRMSLRVSSNLFNNSSVVAQIDGANSFGCVYAGTVSINVGPVAVLVSEAALYAQVGDVNLLAANVSVLDNAFDNSTLSIQSELPVGVRVSGGAFSFALGTFMFSFSWAPSTMNTAVTVANTSAEGLIFDAINNSCVGCSTDFVGLSTIMSTVLYGASVSFLVGSFASSSGSYVYLSVGVTLLANSRINVIDNSFLRCHGSTALVSGQSYSQDAYGVLSFVIASYAYVNSIQSGAPTVCTMDATLVTSLQFVLTRCAFEACGSSAIVETAQTGSVGNSVFGGCASVRYGGSVYSYGVYGNVLGSIGGVFVDNSSHVISDCTFLNCIALSQSGFAYGRAAAYGGSLYIAVSSALYVSNSDPGNVAMMGPARTSNVTLDISNSSFSGSTSASNAQACVFANTTSALGGALYVEVPGAISAIIRQCSFRNCSASVGCSSFLSSSLAAGGAVAALNLGGAGALVMSNCGFSDCFSSGTNFTTYLQVVGGAVATFNTDIVRVSACSFKEFALPYGLLDANTSGGTAIYAYNIHNFNAGSSVFASSLGSPNQNFGVINVQSDIQANGTVTLVNCSVAALSSALVVFTRADTQVRVVIVDSVLGIASTPGSLFQTGSNAVFSGSEAVFRCPSGSYSRFSKSHIITADCSQCPSGSYAVTPSVLDISALNHADLLSQIVESCNSTCPFGISDCNTAVTVAEGFWGTFSPVFGNGRIELFLTVAPCSQGYCCQNINGCPLPPPIFNGSFVSLNDTFDCHNGLQGVLCGTCLEGYTRSLAFKGCIPNQLCEDNIGWSSFVLVVSIVGMAFALLLGAANAESSSGCASIVLFFLQMTQFAVPQQQVPFESAVTQVAFLQSLLSFAHNSCFTKDVSAASLIAYRLFSAPAIGTTAVLLFIAFKYLAARIPQLRPSVMISQFLDGICVQAIVLSTLSFGYSSLLVYMTTLTACQVVPFANASLPSFVLSIDGNIECYQWWQLLCFAGLVCAAALPLSFTALLSKRYEKHLDIRARHVICSAFKPRFYWWGSVLMTYRLFMLAASTFVLQRMQACLCTGAIVLTMLVVGIYVSPWKRHSAHIFDVTCSAALLAKIVLAFGSSSVASVARAPSPSSPLVGVLQGMETASATLTMLPVAMLLVVYSLRWMRQLRQCVRRGKRNTLTHVLLHSIADDTAAPAADVKVAQPQLVTDHAEEAERQLPMSATLLAAVQSPASSQPVIPPKQQPTAEPHMPSPSPSSIRSTT